MSASDSLNQRQFYDVPNVVQHDHIDNDPQYWHSEILTKKAPHTTTRMLPPDHVLHTAQDFLDPKDENVYVQNPSINGSPYSGGGSLHGHPDLPHVAHVPGVGDVIAHGHHRIAAARYRGEPVPVAYTEHTEHSEGRSAASLKPKLMLNQPGIINR